MVHTEWFHGYNVLDGNLVCERNQGSGCLESGTVRTRWVGKHWGVIQAQHLVPEGSLVRELEHSLLGCSSFW